MARQRKRRIKLSATPVNPTVEVDNPFYYGRDGHGEAAKKVRVERAVRHDPLWKLKAARRLNEVEYGIGRDLQDLFEAAQVGGIKGMDLTREPVDGGRMVPDGISDRQLGAIKRLNRVYRLLGKLGSSLVFAVIADGMTPEAYARSLGVTEEREINSFGREFRRYLNALACELGYEAVARPSGMPHTKHYDLKSHPETRVSWLD